MTKHYKFLSHPGQNEHPKDIHALCSGSRKLQYAASVKKDTNTFLKYFAASANLFSFEKVRCRAFIHTKKCFDIVPEEFGSDSLMSIC